MKSESCKCAEVDSVSMTTINLARSHLQARCHDLFQVQDIDSAIETIFSYGGKVGLALACGPDDEPWDRAALALPTSFGFFVSTVDVQQKSLESSERKIALELGLTLRLFPPQVSDIQIWEGTLTLTGDVYDPASFTAIPAPSDTFNELGVPGFLKKYDWRCLAKCAPGCITCLYSIECWALCAGACVISCALPF